MHDVFCEKPLKYIWKIWNSSNDVNLNLRVMLFLVQLIRNFQLSKKRSESILEVEKLLKIIYASKSILSQNYLNPLTQIVVRIQNLIER